MRSHKHLSCLCLLLLLPGCIAPASPAGLAQLDLAKEQYQSQSYVAAVHTLSVFLRNESLSRQVSHAYYLRGLCYRQMDPPRLDLAIMDFERAIKLKSVSAVRPFAHVALGHIYFEGSPANLEKAVTHYQEALKELENSEPKDAVLYRLAYSMQKLGQWSKADLYLSRCFNDFGDSVFANYARDRFGSQTWRLQTGAFRSLEHARTMVRQLRQAGWQVGWRSRKKNNELLYVVRCEQYNTYARAQSGLAQLRLIEPSAQIVPGRLSGLSQ